jgi:hypothetical protein
MAGATGPIKFSQIRKMYAGGVKGNDGGSGSNGSTGGSTTGRGSGTAATIGGAPGNSIIFNVNAPYSLDGLTQAPNILPSQIAT